MARQVYIVRHGNTFDSGDTVTRVGARTDLALSVSGREQAERLGQHFAGAGIGFARIIAGPLKRTRETASLIQKAQSRRVPLEIAAFLREIDYGPDENRPEPDVVARLGEAALAAWEQDAVPPPGWKVDPDALTAAWTALFEVLASEDADGPALVVTSNGIARFALFAAASRSGTAGPDLKLKTGAYGIAEVSPGAPARITAWNERP